MNEKLDKKLAAYEKKRRITNDGELLDALERIIDRETRRPPRKMDTELIAECTKLALTLRGADPAELAKEGAEASRRAAREALEEYRRKNNKETSRTPSPRRLFILIPAIALLVAMMTVVVSSSEGHMFTKSEIENMEPGKVYVKDEGEVIVSKDNIYGIKNLDELYMYIYNPDVLLPYGLGSDYNIYFIQISDFINYKMVLIKIKDENKKDSMIEIDLGKSWEVELETERIGNKDVSLSYYDNTYQADFEYKCCTYSIWTYSNEKRNTIINSLKTGDGSMS